VAFEALLAIVTEPDTAPAAVGANVACSAVDCPAAIVTGAANPLMLNAAPAKLTCETAISLDPELVSVTACVLLPFTSTVPKFNPDVLSESFDCA
jgi:hypothetical protein